MVENHCSREVGFLKLYRDLDPKPGEETLIWLDTPKTEIYGGSMTDLACSALSLMHSYEVRS